MTEKKIEMPDECAVKVDGVVMAAPDGPSFVDELCELINRRSMEHASDTPDFILAEYLGHCLEAFTSATRARDKWRGFPAFKP